MLIRATNNLDVLAEYTYLSNTEVSGTTILRVKNISPFSSSWAVQIGKTGEAQSEVKMTAAGAVSGTSITTTGTIAYDHPADTPIYATKYDQIVFERSTTGTSGTATPMTSGTVTITPNLPYTQFDDTTGASTYAYRTYYQNSVSAGTTTESDWLTPAGFAFYSLAKMRQRVQDKLVNATYIPDTSMIDDWLNEWLETMNNSAIDVDEGYSMGTFSLGFSGTTELGTITQTDFKQLRRVWYVDGGGTFQATKMETNTYSPNKTFTTTFPYFYMEGDTIIGRKPSDSSGTLVCEYYKLPAVLVNDTDTIPVNMQGYTKSFINYAVGQALFKDQKIEEAKMKIGEAMADKELFKKEISPRNKTGVTYIDMVEDTGSNQELWL